MKNLVGGQHSEQWSADGVPPMQLFDELAKFVLVAIPISFRVDLGLGNVYYHLCSMLGYAAASVLL